MISTRTIVSAAWYRISRALSNRSLSDRNNSDRATASPDNIAQIVAARHISRIQSGICCPQVAFLDQSFPGIPRLTAS